jgi:4-diphosphocytidyl-2-C-methyl-D-erythritol kinase
MHLTRKSYTRVTLALDIVRKIEEGEFKGYHELGTIKHAIDLCDTVSIEESDFDIIECDDPVVPCDERNVCLKAVRLVQNEYDIDRHVSIRLRKRIPVKGGLAGGSANAATTLQLLNELWDLKLASSALITLGRRIGMDVPFYFVGKSAFDAEAGLTLTPIPTNCVFSFVLAIPDFGVSTAEAYAGIDHGAVNTNSNLSKTLRDALVVDDKKAVFAAMHNDFERSVFSRFPRLAVIKHELLEAGCKGAVMTGSGSTVIGITEDRGLAETIAGKIENCRTIIASTLTEKTAQAPTSPSGVKR